MENYCIFHQEKHLEKTCPQRSHNRAAMMTNFIHTLLVDENPKQSKEANEFLMAEESSGVGHSVNAFHVIYNVHKQSVEEPSMSEAPPQQKNSNYNLKSRTSC